MIFNKIIISQEYTILKEHILIKLRYCYRLRYDTAFLAIMDVNFERLKVGEIIELGSVW